MSNIENLAQASNAEASINAAAAEEVQELDFFAELKVADGNQKYITLGKKWNELEITNMKFVVKPNRQGVKQKWFQCDVLSWNGENQDGKVYSTTSTRVLNGVKDIIQAQGWKPDEVRKIRIFKDGEGFQTQYIVEAMGN